MNIDQDSDIMVASIAKVRDDGSKSEGEGLDELDLEDVEEPVETEDAPETEDITETEE